MSIFIKGGNMRKIKFKTNFKCSGCVDKAKPVLDENPQISNWDVDLKSADKLLTIEAENLDKQRLIRAVGKVGYRLEEI